MRTIDEVEKIVADLDREPSEGYIAQSVISTDDVILSLLQRPVHEQIDNSVDYSNEIADRAKLHYYLPLKSDRKIIGFWIVFFKKIVRKVLKYLFTPIVDKQSSINTEVLTRLDNNQRELADITNAISENREKTDVAIDELKSKFSNDMEALKTILSKQRDSYELSVFRAINNPKASVQVKKKEFKQEELQNFDYFDFENQFRGARDKIKETLRQYLRYIKTTENVVDLGCGRGEFLELLKEENINAVGVDISQEFVDWCVFNGYNAIYGDAIDYLSSVDESSIDAITGMQLAEHLGFDKLLELCDLAYKKLSDNGVLILETPNPTCLSIYTNAFYLDPTHSKPVHPMLLKYIVEKAGFREVDLVFTESSNAGYRLPLLKAPAENLSEFNDGINALSDLLLGSQDYAIIATK